jgi:hypothetical protein
MREWTIGLTGRGAVLQSLARAVSSRSDLRLVGQTEPGASLPDAEFLVCAGLNASERAAVAALALAAGRRLATPPLPAVDEHARQALTSGLVVQVSPLLGYAALRELAERVRRGELGRRYGLFALHHLPRSAAAAVDDALADLLHYALEALENPVVGVYARRSALFGDQADSWHAILRLADETLVTLEVGASLPAGWPEPERLLVEATGSGAVLRAEPTRQVVVASDWTGSTRAVPWMPDPSAGYLEAALARLEQPDPPRELRYLEVLSTLWVAAAEHRAVPV